jgi:hypothetical protein
MVRLFSTAALPTSQSEHCTAPGDVAILPKSHTCAHRVRNQRAKWERTSQTEHIDWPRSFWNLPTGQYVILTWPCAGTNCPGPAQSSELSRNEAEQEKNCTCRHASFRGGVRRELADLAGLAACITLRMSQLRVPEVRIPRGFAVFVLVRASRAAVAASGAERIVAVRAGLTRRARNHAGSGGGSAGRAWFAVSLRVSVLEGGNRARHRTRCALCNTTDQRTVDRSRLCHLGRAFAAKRARLAVILTLGVLVRARRAPRTHSTSSRVLEIAYKRAAALRCDQRTHGIESPASHSLHALTPEVVSALNRPTSHCRHAEAPVTTTKRPANTGNGENAK